MSKNATKIILILSCILLVTSIGASCVISQNGHHLDNCCDTECIYCNIIHIAQELIYKVLISYFGIIAVIYAISYIIFKIYTYHYMFVPRSLVFQNVQLNE